MIRLRPRKKFIKFRILPLAFSGTLIYNIIRRADVAQSVERILGKDEVGGSNPPISSTHRKPQGFRFFCLFSSLESTYTRNDMPVVFKACSSITPFSKTGHPLMKTALIPNGFSWSGCAFLMDTAVNGEPYQMTDDALGIIDEVEEPRDFYAGFVGWCRGNGDGEYMVSIRCAEIAGAGARAWAGGGVVGKHAPHIAEECNVLVERPRAPHILEPRGEGFRCRKCHAAQFAHVREVVFHPVCERGEMSAIHV